MSLISRPIDRCEHIKSLQDRSLCGLGCEISTVYSKVYFFRDACSSNDSSGECDSTGLKGKLQAAYDRDETHNAKSVVWRIQIMDLMVIVRSS